MKHAPLKLEHVRQDAEFILIFVSSSNIPCEDFISICLLRGLYLLRLLFLRRFLSLEMPSPNSMTTVFSDVERGR